MATTEMNIPRVVRTLLAFHGKQQGELADHMHLGQSVMSKKLSGLRGWSAEDVASLADFFGVPVDLFYRDPDTLVRSRCFLRRHRIVAAI